MVRNFLLIILLFLFSYQTLANAPDYFITKIDLKQETLIDGELEKLGEAQFFVSTIYFIVDNMTPEAEMKHITGLHNDQAIDATMLRRAISQLKRKARFTSVIFEFRKKSSNNYILHIYIQSDWVFKNITFRGMLQGKDAYRHLYLLEPGEAFDIGKHTSSVEKIQDALMQQGYLAAKVYDYLEYDYKKKSIAVRMKLDYGQQFYIDSCLVETQNQECAKALNALAYSECANKIYTKERVVVCANKLRDYLLQQGFYKVSIRLKESIESSNGAVEIIFIVTINEKKRFIFEGNSFFSANQLYDIIFAFGKSGALLPIDLLKQEITTAYQAQGFWDVGIITHEYDACYYFFITEGKRIALNAVRFIGNKKITSLQLESFFTKLCKGKWYNERLLNDTVHECLAFYKEQGFLEARIIKKEFIHQKADEYDVGITLEEGPQFFLQSIEINTCEELLQEPIFKTCKNRYFSPSSIKDQKLWLLAHFQQLGFLYVKATPNVHYDGYNVSIIWHLENVDEPVRFDKPIVVGTTSLPINKILRELDFQEGDIWCKQKLEESLQRLRKLGIFETIYLYPYDIAKPESKKSIIIKLREDEPFEVRVRAGFQQVSRTFGDFHRGSTYKIGGSVLYKNPFNEADFIRSDIDVTRFYRNFAVQYRRPWIFNKPVAFQAKGYSNKYIQPVFIGSDKPLYQAIQQGGLIALSKAGRWYDFGINTGIETMEIDNLSRELACAINFEPRLIDQKIPYYFMEPTMMLNFLDDPLNPSYGSLTIFSCKTMVPWKSITVSFFKLLFEHSFFIPIKRTVLAFRLRAGHIFNQDFETIMPPERFYLGGPNSLRSYQPNLAPPLGCFIDDKGKRQLVPQGAKTMANINLEYRFPVMWKIGMVIFQDLGVLAQRSLTEVVQGGKLLAGTGFGIRYNTPVGPVRFDLGFRWKRQDPDEDRYVWYLTLGQAF